MMCVLNPTRIWAAGCTSSESQDQGEGSRGGGRVLIALKIPEPGDPDVCLGKEGRRKRQARRMKGVSGCRKIISRILGFADDQTL